MSAPGIDNPLSEKPSPPALEPLLVDAKGLARLLSISPATVWRMVSAGKLPRAVRPSPGVVRWKVEEIRRWLDAGTPDLATWEATRVEPASPGRKAGF